MADHAAIHCWESEGGSTLGLNETDTVRQMFAAFTVGDLNALLDTVHPRSRWVYHGANPRLTKAEFNGRREVRSFFEGIMKRLEITAFNTNEFVALGKTVVVFGSESGKVRATGQAFLNEWAQKYVVEAGLIVDMAEWNVQIGQ